MATTMANFCATLYTDNVTHSYTHKNTHTCMTVVWDCCLSESEVQNYEDIIQLHVYHGVISTFLSKQTDASTWQKY